MTPVSILSPSSSRYENVKVMLSIITGTFEQGFRVKLQIFAPGSVIHPDRQSCRSRQLPPAPEIPHLFSQWQRLTQEGSRTLQQVIDQDHVTPRTAATHQPPTINEQDGNDRGIVPVNGQVTNVAEWGAITDQLDRCCRQWFASSEFVHLGDRIRNYVDPQLSVPIVISPELPDPSINNMLAQLPWHLWGNLFRTLPKAESAVYGGAWQSSPPLTFPVRILAILGSADESLNLNRDREALSQLEQRGGQLEILRQPSFETIYRRLSEEAWDVLFFAGHSSCGGEGGLIQLDSQTTLDLAKFRPILQTAVARGLQLAIFNSCDGMDMAQFLANDVGLSLSIVMRQPVPDQFAGEFATDFLDRFSRGQSIYAALRSARTALGWQDATFPGVSWLPMAYINLNQPPLVWPLSPPEQRPNPKPTRNTQWFSTSSRWIRRWVGVAIIGFLLALLGSHWSSPSDPSGVRDLISNGEKEVQNTRINLSEPYLTLKQRGIAAFIEKDYDTALSSFESLRRLAKQNKADATTRSDRQLANKAFQDYESLIYRNNALVLQRQQQYPPLSVYGIAVAAPLNFDAGTGIAYGVAQAQDVLVNEQRLNLLVTLANDRNQEADAQAVAKELAARDDILAVVGHYTYTI